MQKRKDGRAVIYVATIKLIDLIDKGLSQIDQPKSRAEIKRLIEAGAVEIGGEKFIDPSVLMVIREGAVVRVGKKIFFKIGNLRGKEIEVRRL